MSAINNGGPAFPGTQYAKGISPSGHCEGLSLRDYFAAKAMQGMAASKEHCTDGWAHSDIAIQAYNLADAMLRARSNT